MGSGIAQSAALAGASVRIRDVDAGAVARGLGTVERLTIDASKKGVIDRRESVRVIARTSGTTDYSGFRRAALVIEAVFEELAIKRRVVAELEDVLRDDAVIASNTSALPIAEIASGARHPERIVGMHFFSPVHRMPLVEVVRPAKADPAAVARVVAAGQAMGKTVIVVRDGPGFYTTRVLGMVLGEAGLLLEDGARIDDIDRAWTAFGWPIGPLALLDEVGLNVASHAAATVATARGLAARPTAVQLLADAGLVGKRGAGFYRYQSGHREPNPRVYELLKASGLRRIEGIAERLTLLLVNEAARCLDEGVLSSPVDGDLGAVLGFGFPPFLGGPFRWADTRGAELRDALRALAAKHGDRYAPAESLASGRRFYA
jgi:3-hydroxyacyl-CoA dehydrogenase/enoyl-CoA hydratase/3-hydroxybutyryl-CoA epimerase